MFTVQMTPETGFLRFTVKGVLDASTDLAIDEAIRSACMERGARLALVDISATEGRLSLLENHVAAASFRQRMEGVLAVAIVDLAVHAANSEMFGLTAGNRGAIVRFFDDDGAASEWLRGLPETTKAG